MRKILTVLIIVLLALYPLFVYFGLSYFEAKYLGLLLLVLLLCRLMVAWKYGKGKNALPFLVIIVAGAILCLAAAIRNSEESLIFYPLIVNVVLAMVFFVSLIRPPSAIERIARLRHPTLSEAGVRHTRMATIAWLVFFVANGSISAYTIFYSSLGFWTLYNGVISYLLMAVLFVTEYIFRLRLMKREQVGDGHVA